MRMEINTIMKIVWSLELTLCRIKKRLNIYWRMNYVLEKFNLIAHLILIAHTLRIRKVETYVT